MVYYIEGYSIVFANGQRHRFDDLISQVVEFQDALVLRLDTDSLRRTSQNVFAFDYLGKLLWQIPVRHHFNEHSPYVGLYAAGEMIDAYNWDGQILSLHPRLGTVMSEGHVSVGSSSSRRHASPRSFI